MTIARLLCALAVAGTVAGCGTDIGRTQVRGTPAEGTVGGLHGSKIEGSNDQLAPAAVDVADSEVAQFALPKPAPEGEVPAVQSPKELTFEYVYGSESEAPYDTNADVDSNVSDDSLIISPTVFGVGTVGGLLGSKIEGNNDQFATAAVDVEYRELAQFTLPKPAPGGGAPAAQAPKQLKFEYVYGAEVETLFINNLDLDSGITDDSIIMAPTVFGSVTYRPTDWLETRLEGTLEKLIPVHEHKLITLPDGSIQVADPTPWSLLIDQVYAKIRLPKAPVEVTVGRSLFEDSRLWLFDGELDAFRVMVKPGDFKFEASVSRENLFNLEFNRNIKFTKGTIDNYLVIGEYRGIEDHKLVGYWILRYDNAGEDGKPQFMGVRAHGRPADEFRYWTDLAYVGGEDEFSQDLSGYAFEAGGTYRFLDLPLQPSLTLGYAYGSGDGNPNDNKNHEYRQTGLQSNENRFGGVTQFLVYGETLDPELSNLNIYTAGLGLRPAAGAFVDLVYHHYRLNEIATELRGSPITAPMNQIASQLSKDVGDALDIVVGFRNLFDVRGLGFEVRAGMFFPGDAFRRDEGGVITDADMGFTALAVIFI